MFHLKLSKEMCRLYLSWEISTGDMTASHCVHAEVQPAAREPHINDFLDAMGTQDCPWIWSVQQAAYLWISQPGEHCLSPHISAENNGLATLPSQETKERNTPEQNDSASNSQRCLYPWYGTPIPPAQFSPVWNPLSSMILPLSGWQQVETGRHSAGLNSIFLHPWLKSGDKKKKKANLTLRLYFDWVQALKICCDYVLLNADSGVPKLFLNNWELPSFQAAIIWLCLCCLQGCICMVLLVLTVD